MTKTIILEEWCQGSSNEPIEPERLRFYFEIQGITFRIMRNESTDKDVVTLPFAGIKDNKKFVKSSKYVLDDEQLVKIIDLLSTELSTKRISVKEEIQQLSKEVEQKRQKFNDLKIKINSILDDFEETYTYE